MIRKTCSFTLILFLFFSITLPAQTAGWVITPQASNSYFGACAANGEIGICVGQKPFTCGPIILGGAYMQGNQKKVSRILEGINPVNLSMQIDGEAVDLSAIPTTQQIDLLHAVHSTQFSTKDVSVKYHLRALRNMPYAVMTVVEVSSQRNVELVFHNQHAIPKHFSNGVTEMRDIKCDDRMRKIQRSTASYNEEQAQISASSLFLYPKGCNQEKADALEINLRAGERKTFALIGIICTSTQFNDPFNETDRQAIYADLEGMDALIAAHEQRWATLWKGDILIDNDAQAQLDVRFALYNLYSSIREGSQRSIAPMGLTSRGYNGHIFWDSELWMYPALLVVHPELARQMLDYRIQHLDKSCRRAYAHGYRGAMYPWESDEWGEESTPTYALTGPQEHHITADIAIACWNYYCVTGDLTWLKQQGYPLLREVAEFWCDRVRSNSDGSYSICNVVGANEYATNVTDNAFTNGAARRALEYAKAAAKVCGEKANPQWEKVAANLRLPQFEDGTTREHAAYDGRMIKQADANLLGYPLGIITERNRLLKDLNYYENRIDPKHGPAMSYAVFTIQYARLGLIDKATEMFQRTYEPNLRPPFRVFAETPTSKNPYFMTGAGGMLQAVIFGFGGLHITPQGLIQKNPILPKQWKGLTIQTPDKVFRYKK